MVQPHDTPSLPWYKQFYPWLVFGLPLTAVIAGLVTVYIALDGADAPVRKDYYQAGIRINEHTRLIENGQRLGMSATLLPITKGAPISLKLDGPQANVKFLHLLLRHPAYEQLDRTLQLQRQPSTGAFDATFELPMDGKWYLSLTDNDQTWLIETKVVLPNNSPIQLSPASQ